MTTLFSQIQKDPALPQRKEDNTSNMTFTSYFYDFLEKIKTSAKKTLISETEGTIHVSEVFGVLAFVYEKIRGAVEYKRDHLLRRNAIERILRRLLWERQGRNLEITSQLLLRELIWAKYLPNDSIPKSKITEIAKIIYKYLELINLLGGYISVSQKHRDWIIGVCSCDIEESLDENFQRGLYVELMYQWFVNNFSWKHSLLSEHEKSMQLYLAIHRSLPKSDEAIMRYHILINEMPKWKNPNKEDILKLVQNFSKLQSEIEKHLSHPIHLHLFRFVKKQSPPFEILQEVVQKRLPVITKLVENPDKLEGDVRQVCQLKYSEIRQKVNRGIARSIVYIFVTKVLLALIIEIPYDLYFLGKLALIPIGLNVVIPPLLMFLIGLTIKTPGEKNTKRILTRIKNVVYHGEHVRQTPFSLTVGRKRSLLTTVFGMFYLMLFIITFGGISALLVKLNFTVVNSAIFFMFLSLVLLFGFRVRSTATELSVTNDREGILGYILNNLSLPFLNLGVLLSKGIAKLNFFILIMDFLIEAPLKTIIEVIEEWTAFIREKREEVIDVPPE